MKRLFNEKYSAYTPEARKFSCEAAEALKPIVAKALEGGFCLRDLHYVLQDEVSSAICFAILDKAVKTHKEG